MLHSIFFEHKMWAKLEKLPTSQHCNRRLELLAIKPSDHTPPCTSQAAVHVCPDSTKGKCSPWWKYFFLHTVWVQKDDRKFHHMVQQQSQNKTLNIVVTRMGIDHQILISSFLSPNGRLHQTSQNSKIPSRCSLDDALCRKDNMFLTLITALSKHILGCMKNSITYEELCLKTY